MKTFLNLAAVTATIAAGSAVALPVGITGLTLGNGDPAVVTANGSLVTSFSSGGITNGNLLAPTGATPSANAGLGSQIYGIAGTPVAGIASTTNLDASNGLANVTQPAGSFVDYQFGQAFSVTGATGAGNDFFLLELGSSPGTPLPGDDNIVLQALDGTGGLIGEPITILAASFGDTGKDIRFGINSSSESGASPRNIAGVGLDVSDFGTAAALGTITGFRLSSPGFGLDPLVVGANRDALATEVPEPASALLLAAGLGTLALRRRRA